MKNFRSLVPYINSLNLILIASKKNISSTFIGITIAFLVGSIKKSKTGVRTKSRKILIFILFILLVIN